MSSAACSCRPASLVRCKCCTNWSMHSRTRGDAAVWITVGTPGAADRRVRLPARFCRGRGVEDGESLNDRKGRSVHLQQLAQARPHVLQGALDGALGPPGDPGDGGDLVALDAQL